MHIEKYVNTLKALDLSKNTKITIFITFSREIKRVLHS